MATTKTKAKAEEKETEKVEEQKVEEDKKAEPEVTQRAYRRTTGRVKTLEERMDIVEEALRSDLGVDLEAVSERIG